jgi:tRNA threonylcarbamoyladenosine biosynthesis protein TsaE
MVTINCPTEEATQKLGSVLGQFLTDGDVVLLNGDLGAGKTTLVTAAAAAMGVDPKEVTSPTFSLMNVYRGKRLSIKHFDLYRINWPEELEDIGFSEYAGQDGVTFIEWANLFPDAVPEEHLEIELKRDGQGRQAVLTAQGAHYEELLGKVREQC